ncbi:hypothetical protein E3N88_05871 [Mikania micrantha]|uniref:OTU domain-containing protein n=1 Tax=Mikania micrantha TaxID=192012 RepID=A0A5N6PP03_9ASTR|nr:hypothetical protein E3N88_05871 [Mikania micrantha]
MENTQELEEKQTNEIQVEKETREDMLSRHRKEITQLQNKEVTLKKAAAKGSKAEQKAKKKQVEEQISQLTTELKEKHVNELTSAGYANTIATGKAKEYNIDILAKAIAGVSVTNQPEHSKPTKKTVTDGDYDDSVVEKRFESYCNEIESTAAWGGQLELGALTHCLKKHIMIFSGSFPDVEMGKEYKSGESLDSSIMLSYHKHAFGLGEHYNSVVPV